MSLFVAAAATAGEGGTVTGVVVRKDERSITVRAEGEKEGVKYIPEWHGGKPKDGGSLDKKMLAKIKAIPVGSRVRLTWDFSEHKRVTALERLEPEQKEGTITGEVVEVSERHLQIRSEGEIHRFTPRWTGGMPKDGGGLDKEMTHRLAKVKVGQTLRVSWIYDERPRVIDFDVIK